MENTNEERIRKALATKDWNEIKATDSVIPHPTGQVERVWYATLPKKYTEGMKNLTRQNI